MAVGSSFPTELPTTSSSPCHNPHPIATILIPGSEELDKVVEDTGSTSQKAFYLVDVTQP
jgi:hypothetical protein